jgi:mono/diheme cytochrome c family protein
VPREPETAFTQPFVEPIATMFTVPSNYNFHDPACRGVDFICWPTVGASSIEYYASKGMGIPGWERVLLITTLKRGSLYVLPLTPDGHAASGHFMRYFQSENRYRDTAVSPDGRTIFIATDQTGLAEALAGGPAAKLQNPGEILAFTYDGEDGPRPAAGAEADAPRQQPTPFRSENEPNRSGAAAAFTEAEAVEGRAAYNSNCAVCHGNTLTNGTFAPPLAGEYFKNAWTGKTVGALFERVKSMPPAAPGSLPGSIYVQIVAYLLQSNGAPAGTIPLEANRQDLDRFVIR